MKWSSSLKPTEPWGIEVLTHQIKSWRIFLESLHLFSMTVLQKLLFWLLYVSLKLLHLFHPLFIDIMRFFCVCTLLCTKSIVFGDHFYRMLMGVYPSSGELMQTGILSFQLILILWNKAVANPLHHFRKVFSETWLIVYSPRVKWICRMNVYLTQGVDSMNIVPFLRNLGCMWCCRLCFLYVLLGKLMYSLLLCFDLLEFVLSSLFCAFLSFESLLFSYDLDWSILVCYFL